MTHRLGIKESDVEETIQCIPLPMASFRVESDSRFLLHATNQALRSILRGDGDAAYGRSVLELNFASPAILQGIQQLFEKATASRLIQSDEQPLQIQHQSPKFLYYSATPIWDDTGVKLIVVTVRDSTEVVRSRRKRQVQLSKMASSKFVVCAWCSSIRGDKGNWQTVDNYVRQNYFKRPMTELCPDCNQSH